MVVNGGFEAYRGEDGDEAIGWAFTSYEIIGFFPKFVPGSFFKRQAIGAISLFNLMIDACKFQGERNWRDPIQEIKSG